MKEQNHIEQLALPEKRWQLIRKDHHIRNRRYNGAPHLRLKAVKEHPRNQIRSLLRSMVSLSELKLPLND